MNGRELRTRFAVRALDFAETFNAGLGSLSLKPAAYQPQLTAPDGPSTGGGVQAIQHVRLVPSRQGYPSILVGSANQRLGTAELRSFEYIEAVHRERWKRPVPLDRPDYEDFLEAARNFFEGSQLVVSMASAPARISRRAPADDAPLAPSAASGTAILTGVIAGLVMGGLTIWILLRRVPAPTSSPPLAPTSATPLPTAAP